MVKKIVAPTELVPHLQEMLFELKLRKFRAFQVPDNRPSAIDGKNIWVAESHNPPWYSKLLRKYPKYRNKELPKAWKRVRPYDSNITRKDIVRVLTCLLNGGATSKYAKDLLQIAEDREGEMVTVESYAEWYFARYYRIALNTYESGVIEHFEEKVWDEIAHYMKKNARLPEWIIDWHDKEVPF